MRIRKALSLLIFILLMASSVLTLTREEERIIEVLRPAAEPVKITKLMLKQKAVGSRFTAGDDWVKDLSVEVKNISWGEVIYLKLELSFPVDETGRRLLIVPLEYGTSPEDVGAMHTAPPLQTGEAVSISAAPGHIDNLKERLRVEGRGEALKLKRVKLYTYQVWFTKDRMWMNGTDFEGDPKVKGRWNIVGSG